MACVPAHVLEVAEALQQVSNQGNDSAARSSISRAYYAAFLHARDKAGIPDTSAGVHQLTINHYNSIGCTKAAQYLDRLRIERNRADYELALSFTQISAGQQIKRAKDIIRFVDLAIP